MSDALELIVAGAAGAAAGSIMPSVFDKVLAWARIIRRAPKRLVCRVRGHDVPDKPDSITISALLTRSLYGNRCRRCGRRPEGDPPTVFERAMRDMASSLRAPLIADLRSKVSEGRIVYDEPTGGVFDITDEARERNRLADVPDNDGTNPGSMLPATRIPHPRDEADR